MAAETREAYSCRTDPAVPRPDDKPVIVFDDCCFVPDAALMRERVRVRTGSRVDNFAKLKPCAAARASHDRR